MIDPMTDFNGKELRIDDDVVWTRSGATGHNRYRAVVVGFTAERVRIEFRWCGENYKATVEPGSLIRYTKYHKLAEYSPDAELERHKELYGEDEVGLLCMIKDAVLPCFLYYDGERWHDNADHNYTVTHWAPVPDIVR